MDNKVHNLMMEHPELFQNIAARREFCRAWNWMPVDTVFGGPHPDHAVKRSSQYVCLACLRPEVEAKWQQDRSKKVRRTVDYITPTGLLYEADGITVKEQQQNLKPGALRYFASVTFSGKKSLHFVAPIPKDQGQRLQGVPGAYRKVWRHYAELFFRDPSVLDEKTASIGRLTRMPGATRYQQDDQGNLDFDRPVAEQTCVFLQRDPAPLPDIESVVTQALVVVAGADLRHAARRYFRSFEEHDYDHDLDRLRKSVNIGSPYKQVILEAIEHGDVPAEPDLPAGCSLIGSVLYCKGNYPGLAEQYIGTAVAAHPTNLTRGVAYYLGQQVPGTQPAQPAQPEQAAQAEGKAAV